MQRRLLNQPPLQRLDLGAGHAVGDAYLQVLRERRLDAVLSPEADGQRDDEEEEEGLHGAEW